MKPLFLDCPPRYTRASRNDVSPVDYACPVSATIHKHDKIVLIGSTVAAAALAAILFIWG